MTSTIANVFDEEPPYFASQFNYDYATYSPLGHAFKIGLEYRIE